MDRKFALIIGNSEYDDTKLADLKAPDADVQQLSELLRDQGIGAFDDVLTLTNPHMADAQERIADFFADKKSSDLLLLYFSGHGVLDERGRLYLAVRNTRRERLSGTALPARFITDEMDGSMSKRQVLILDCCHSGAFSQGTKAATDLKAVTRSTFEGNGFGRIVLTATDSTEFAWEGDKVIGEAKNSLFTHYLIEGLKTGAADADGDGRITLDELYNYIYERVLAQTSKQTPSMWADNARGEVIIAKNPLPQALKLDEPRSEVKYGTIRINVNLKWGLFGQRAYIFIDGEEVTSTTKFSFLTVSDKSFEVVVTSGQHTVSVKYSFMKSNMLSINVSESETVRLVCKQEPGAWFDKLVLAKDEQP